MNRHSGSRRHVSNVPRIGIGGAYRLRPSRTTVRTGPYTAVREVTLTRFDQGRKTERFEVGIGESDGEGFAPGEMPGSTAASGHVAQPPRDSPRDECCSPTPWCFPLAPEGSPQSQPDPTSESDQHLGRFAKAEIAAPTPHIRDQFFHCRLDADAFGLRVISRIRRLSRSSDFGAIVRLMSRPAVKLNPRNFRSCGRAAALLASFTLSLSFCVMKREMLSITR
jgi:hypothetical protein